MFYLGCLRISPEHCDTITFSDWLFSTNCILPIVSLNFSIQYIPRSGVMSLLAVISVYIFCFLFSYPMSTVIFPQNFSWVTFTSWYQFIIVCISVYFSICSSGGITVTGEPVSLMNSFCIVFTRNAFLFFIVSISSIQFSSCSRLNRSLIRWFVLFFLR